MDAVIEDKQRTIQEDIDLFIIDGNLALRHKDGSTYTIGKDVSYYDEVYKEDIKRYTPINIETITDEEFSNLNNIIKDFISYKKKEAELENASDTFYSHSLNKSLIDSIGRSSNKELFDKIDYIKNIVCSIYESHNVVIIPDVKSKEFACYINFPEVNISNNMGKSRKLYNLVVQFTFRVSHDKLTMGSSIGGCRLTLSQTEMMDGYHHSHLSRNKGFTFNSFCLGDTDIKTTLLDLSVSFNEMNFELLLCMLKNYVVHESLEGGPYIPMDTLGPKGSSFYLTYSVINKIKSEEFLNSLRNYSINYNAEDGGFYIISSDSFINEIKDKLDESKISRDLYMVNRVEGSDNEYKINSINYTSEAFENLVTDEEVEEVAKAFGIEIKVIKDDEDNFIINEHLSNQVVDSIKESLTLEINKYFIEKYGPCGF